VADEGDGDDVVVKVSALVNRGKLNRRPKALDDRKKAFKKSLPLFQ